MMTVFKYELRIIGVAGIDMPKGAEILHVERQTSFSSDIVCLWAKVDTEAPLEMRMFHVTGTGQKVPEKEGKVLKYICTIQIPPYVWHIWELVDG